MNYKKEEAAGLSQARARVRVIRNMSYHSICLASFYIARRHTQNKEVRNNAQNPEPEELRT
jgi:hypothetical protein